MLFQYLKKAEGIHKYGFRIVVRMYSYPLIQKATVKDERKQIPLVIE